MSDKPIDGNLIDIESILKKPEDEVLEFKYSIPENRTLIREIAAMANAQGGQIVLGVHETAAGNSVHGVEPSRAAAAVNRAARMLQPSPKYELHVLPSGEKSVVVITVHPNPSGIILTQDGQIFVRKGASTRPADMRDLMGAGVEQASREELLIQLKSMSAVVIKLSKDVQELKKAGHWPRQLLWCVGGAILGTILGAIATLIIGG